MSAETAVPFFRITRDPAEMSGRPCIGGLRVAVGRTLGDGVAVDDLVPAGPHLQREDVLDAGHRADLGRALAPDDQIPRWEGAQDRIVMTGDLDLGTLPAVSAALVTIAEDRLRLRPLIFTATL